MIQLQHCNSAGQHLGGLYVKKNEIAAVYATRFSDGEFVTDIVLNSGKEFRVTSSVLEILEMLADDVQA